MVIVRFLFGQVIVSASMFGERAKQGRWVPVGLVSVGRLEKRPAGGFGCRLASSGDLVERQLELEVFPIPVAPAKK